MKAGQQRDLFGCGLPGEQRLRVLAYDFCGFGVGEDEVGHIEILAKEKERCR